MATPDAAPDVTMEDDERATLQSMLRAQRKLAQRQPISYLDRAVVVRILELLVATDARLTTATATIARLEEQIERMEADNDTESFKRQMGYIDD